MQNGRCVIRHNSKALSPSKRKSHPWLSVCTTNINALKSCIYHILHRTHQTCTHKHVKHHLKSVACCIYDILYPIPTSPNMQVLAFSFSPSANFSLASTLYSLGYHELANRVHAGNLRSSAAQNDAPGTSRRPRGLKQLRCSLADLSQRKEEKPAASAIKRCISRKMRLLLFTWLPVPLQRSFTASPRPGPSPHLQRRHDRPGTSATQATSYHVSTRDSSCLGFGL